MQNTNETIFRWIAGGHAATGAWLDMAVAAALWGAWFGVVVIAAGIWRHPRRWPHVLATVVAGILAGMLAHKLAALLAIPRPFMAGLSPSHIPHASRGSLPSAHATVMFTLAAMLGLQRELRPYGWALALVGLVTAWGRIYTGVHYPLDIVAGMLLGIAIAAAYAGLRRICRMLLAQRTKARSPLQTLARPAGP